MFEGLSISSITVLICSVSCILSIFLNDKGCDILYKLTVLLTFFCTSIKYYWGGDIATYVPYYDEVPDVWSLLIGGMGDFNQYLEVGFTLFCSICKGVGIPFWGMTFIINLLLFHSLYLVINKATKYKTLIFCITLTFCIELAFNQIRQGLSCAFFLYFVCALIDNKSVFTTLTFAILCCLCHNSGIFAVVPSFLLCGISKQPFKVKRSYFAVCFLIMIVLMPIDLKDLFPAIAKFLDFDSKIQASLEDAFTGKKISIAYHVLIVPTILIPAIFKDGRNDGETQIMRNFCFIGNLASAVFFSYDRFFARFIIFFFPIVFMYSINLLAYSIEETTYNKAVGKLILLAMQLIIFRFSIATFNRRYQDAVKYHERENPTIISVIFKSEEEIEQIKRQQVIKANESWNEYTASIKKHYSKKGD